MTILVTGGAGFIGSHLCERLVGCGYSVAALDSFDPFYDPAIKRSNISSLEGSDAFTLVEADIRDLAAMESALAGAGVREIDAVVHLAARAGVRPSIQDPLLYTQVNVEGTTAVLELARRHGTQRIVFGSSSSVYGNNSRVPFSERDPVEKPISPYAATKRAGELLCYTYHHLCGMSVVCLRFFTVYGPRQRPDLAIHKFTRLMATGEPIPMYGNGSTERDYTHIDDIIRGVDEAIRYTAADEPVFEIINVGGSRTTSLKRLVGLISAELGIAPQIHHLPAQPGDVERTFADVSKARDLLDYAPETSIEVGITRFVEWFEQQR